MKESEDGWFEYFGGEQKIMKEYCILRIKTDSYAGNFEREMCAYATGATGDCKVGDRESEQFMIEEKSTVYDMIENFPDDHGCWRPCTVDSETDSNNFLIFFDKYCVEDKKFKDDLKIVKRRIKDYAQTHSIKILDFEFARVTVKHIESKILI